MKSKSVLFIVPRALHQMLQIWGRNTCVQIVAAGSSLCGGEFECVVLFTKYEPTWFEEQVRPYLAKGARVFA